MMKIVNDDIKTPATEIEISALINHENMLPAGRLIARKLSYERDMLKNEVARLKRGECICTKCGIRQNTNRERSLSFEST